MDTNRWKRFVAVGASALVVAAGAAAPRQQGTELELLHEKVPELALAGLFGRRRTKSRARSVRRSRPRIEFLCAPEDKGVIAEPVLARTTQPAWFKRLPGQDGAQLSATNNGLTVKRCVPFLDALSIGWIVPLAATVRLEISDGGRAVSAGWSSS